MKLFIPAILLFLSSQTSWAWDSVAVFHRSSKVVVLINEEGAGSRLQNFMRQFTIGSALEFEDMLKGVKISCGRTSEAATCTFRFTPGKNVEIAPREIWAALPVDEIEPLAAPQDGFDIDFENSNGDQFRIWIEDSILYFDGGKKI